MKFSAFKEFRIFPDTTTNDAIKFLAVDITRTLRELKNGLTRLTFGENFESFTTEVTIPAGTEIEIRNELRPAVTPTARIILRGNAGSKDVVDGDTAWSDQFVYLKNTGGASATLTVVFFR